MKLLVPGKGRQWPFVKTLLVIMTSRETGSHRTIKKLLFAMKLTTSLILIASLHVSANTFSQKVTLKGENLSLDAIFESIAQQTGYEFVYYKDVLKQTKPVSIDFKDADITEALNFCLNQQKLSYSIDDKIIVIKIAPLGVGLSPHLQSPPITGVVRGPDGQPIAGVNVVVKGTRKGVVTDAYGRFSIEVEQGKTLVISNIGYNAKEIKVNGENNIIVGLEISTSQLDEVQYIAYGKSSPRFQTGNIASVKAVDIEKQPVNNPLLALQGRVPGLFIQQSSGLSGAGIQVQIQGQNSIVNGSAPLYVIDGVPYPSEIPGTGSSNIGPLRYSDFSGIGLPLVRGFGNALSYVNPSDIESIEVLKDADATAIFGSRAANGAILITTKKGKAGRMTFDINMQQGWGEVTRKLDMMNTRQYLDMRYEAYKNDGIDISSLSSDGSNYDLTLWDTTRYTDWQKELIGGAAQYTNIATSISGGNSAVQYRVGGTFLRETSVFPGDFADKKASMSFDISSSSLNKKFNFKFSGSYLFDNNRLPGADLTKSAFILAPNAPSLYNNDGTLNWMPGPSGASSWSHPLSDYIRTYQNRTGNLIGNAIVSYNILEGLEVRSSFGYNDINVDELRLEPLESTRPESRFSGSRLAQHGNRKYNTWIIEPQLTYNRKIEEGKLDVLLGGTIQQNSNSGKVITGRGFTTDDAMRDIGSASVLLPVTTFSNVYKYAALFGRLNFIWRDKYVVNLTARRDGSSRFGVKNQMSNFGAVGLAWLFHEENFFRKNFTFLSFGKIRTSYGITGSDQIGDYAYLNLYSRVFASIPYQGAIGLTSFELPNPYLEWEVTRKLQFGLELGFLKDRILLNTTYARNRSSNQLLNYTLPSITGFTGVYQNHPATIQNISWEFSINTQIVKTKLFNWSTVVNLTVPRNKVVKFPDIANSTYASGFNGVAIGQPLGFKRIIHFIGVDPSTGEYVVADENGKPTNNPDYSKVEIYSSTINTLPKFYAGVQNSFSYKNIQIDMLFQIVKKLGQNIIYSNGSFLVPGQYDITGGTNQPVSLLSRWEKPGDITNIQRYSSNYTLINVLMNAASSDAAYDDASYVRLKNISVSYQLPDQWKRKAKLQNCRIFIQAQNLWTFTKYQGLDPENGNAIGDALPPLKIITVGLQVTI